MWTVLEVERDSPAATVAATSDATLIHLYMASIQLLVAMPWSQ